MFADMLQFLGWFNDNYFVSLYLTLVYLLKYQVKNNELVEDEDDIPVRSIMWRKARETKDGEYKDDDVRNVANEIVRSVKLPSNLIFTKASCKS